jgi:hypothetical protein
VCCDFLRVEVEVESVGRGKHTIFRYRDEKKNSAEEEAESVMGRRKKRDKEAERVSGKGGFGRKKNGPDEKRGTRERDTERGGVSFFPTIFCIQFA